jgi:hypothetical protein
MLEIDGGLNGAETICSREWMGIGEADGYVKQVTGRLS